MRNYKKLVLVNLGIKRFDCLFNARNLPVFQMLSKISSKLKAENNSVSPIPLFPVKHGFSCFVNAFAKVLKGTFAHCTLTIQVCIALKYINRLIVIG